MPDGSAEMDRNATVVGQAPDWMRGLPTQFASKRVLVVGDVYLDEYVFGEVTGISLEAPIPVFEVRERRYNPGAAGNAACNAASLGGQVAVVGVIGADENGGLLRNAFEKRGVDTRGLVVDANAPTNTYGKLRAGTFDAPSQEVLRTDTPKPEPIKESTAGLIIGAIEEQAPGCDAILVGDQVGSVVTEAVWDAIRRMAASHGIVTVVDSRERVWMFRGATAVVPNTREILRDVPSAGTDPSPASADAAALRDANDLSKEVGCVFLTRGPRGITVFRDGTSPVDVHAMRVQAVDVTGAGDTAAAAITLALASGVSPEHAAALSNRAAGIAVQHAGVVTVHSDSLFGSPVSGVVPKLPKRVGLQQLTKRIGDGSERGETVVWTNGCFDILHAGHITYLIEARAQGDLLVVGLNSDASVQGLKGPNRPIVNEDERAAVLAALSCVDYVVVFDDPSPLAMIKLLRPDVYVKGGDYTIDTINQEERRAVEAYGGRIALLAGVDGRSTTRFIERVMALEA